MELWFILAVGSAVAAGFLAFTHKVAAVKHHDTTTLNFYAATISASILAVTTIFVSNFQNIFHIATLWAFLGGVVFFASVIVRIEALKLIDTTIFFPFYKMASPIFTIILGVILFAEKFSIFEWFGLIISITIPLLLITKEENHRQNNLPKGIQLMLFTSVLSAISMVFMKLGVNVTENIWLYMTAAHSFIAMFAFLLLLRKHKTKTLTYCKNEASSESLRLAFFMGISMSVGVSTIVFSLALSGPLGIVYTINSLYILIPIILSIIFYHEHWNVRKVVAIVLSIAALGLLR